ncbi:hypothetical protein [Micromonospora zhanjiangensis]|uniref:Lipoprotein n=1 Tax=Micromonospora zhanjiangensis TaxID=1522057 RepID=A0ABV8KP60_9ACTN
MRTPRATTAGKPAVVLCVLLLLLGACASGPAPQAWAATVCGALGPWRTEISRLTTSSQQQMTAKTTPGQARENLIRLLSGAEQATETARRKIEQAGVPDVAKGDAVAGGFLSSLTAVRDAYGKAKTAIAGLDTGQAKPFYDGVEATMNTLNAEYKASALDTRNLDSPELKKAFDEVPECR